MKDETNQDFFGYIVSDLLCYSSSKSLLVERVRRSVRAVVPCNVFLADPLSTDNKAAGPAAKDKEDAHNGHSSFDVIISTLCLEFASLSVAEYESAVANVTRLLRPSGYLILQVRSRQEKTMHVILSVRQETKQTVKMLFNSFFFYRKSKQND